LEIEEDYTRKICDDIIALKPDLVITEKGLSGLILRNFQTQKKERKKERKGGEKQGKLICLFNK